MAQHKAGDINILFSDVFGTLVTNKKICDIVGIKEHYSFRRAWDEEFANLSVLLNEYLLQENNYLVLVTSSTHESMSVIYKMFKDLIKNITPEFQNRIMLFVSEVYGRRELFEKDLDEIPDEEQLEINLINNKSESVEIVLQRLKDFSINSIYAIGDSEKDLDMLLLVKGLCGKPVIIGELKDDTIENISSEVIFNYYRIDRLNYQRAYRSIHDNYAEIKNDEKYIKMMNYQEQKKLDLLNLLNEGLCTEEMIKKALHSLELTESYGSIFSGDKGFKDSNTFHAFYKRINRMPVCSNFSQFYNTYIDGFSKEKEL